MTTKTMLLTTTFTACLALCGLQHVLKSAQTLPPQTGSAPQLTIYNDSGKTAYVALVGTQNSGTERTTEKVNLLGDPATGNPLPLLNGHAVRIPSAPLSGDAVTLWMAESIDDLNQAFKARYIRRDSIPLFYRGIQSEEKVLVPGRQQVPGEKFYVASASKYDPRANASNPHQTIVTKNVPIENTIPVFPPFPPPPK
jgi:hypothetical protein